MSTDARVPRTVMFIDTHTHFYDPERPAGVPWPREGTEIYRPVLPEHFRAVAQPCNVTGTVVVEASAWVEDNQWLLDLAANEPVIQGIVGRLDPTDPQFEAHLERFAANPLFRGLRLHAPAIKAGVDPSALKSLSRRNLTLDVLGALDLVPQLRELCAALPDLKIAAHHVTVSPEADGSLDTQWQQHIRAIAELPNVYCKLSGFIEHAAKRHDPIPRDPAFCRPVFDLMLEQLGEDRLLYASNWPVCERGGAYAQQFDILRAWTDQLDPNTVAKIAAKNAHAAYGPLRAV